MMFIWIDPEKDGMTKAIMNKLTRRIANWFEHTPNHHFEFIRIA
jgi:hypothetical protein